jgi:glycosyltransferase involved in cell wall biosynthesis
MINFPLVSIIIPAYNASGWIVETILSVLDQDYDNIEIIVINDGSTDDTENLVSNFGDKVKCINKKNGGQSSARNVGINLAKGKYIAFLDSDDLWIKNKLKVQIEFLESSGLKWIYSDAIAFESKSKNVLFKFSEKSKHYEGDILIKLFYSCFIPMPTVIIHHSVFSTVGLFNEKEEMRNREDWEMWLRIAALYPIALITMPLAFYRIHDTSVTGSETLIQRMHGNILVINEAAIREPLRLDPIKNTVLSKIFFSNGRAQALLGQKKMASKLLIKAIQLDPLWIVPYISWLTIPITQWIEIQRKKLNLISK